MVSQHNLINHLAKQSINYIRRYKPRSRHSS